MASSTPRPDVTLTTDILPSYYEDLGRMSITAFEPSWISQRLFPPDKRASLETWTAANVQTRTLTASHPPSDMREVVALIDGVAAGFATWYAPVDRTSTGGHPLPEEVAFEEKAKKRAEENKTDEVRAIEASMDEVFGGLVKKETGRVRREWSQGRGHWYLYALIVDPAYKNLGIGSKLLSWGTEQAAKEGVPCWLESSKPGRILYDRRGWKVALWCELSYNDDPEEGPYRWPGMALGDFTAEAADTVRG